MLAFYSSAGEKVKTEGKEELPEHLRGEGGASCAAEAWGMDGTGVAPELRVPLPAPNGAP